MTDAIPNRFDFSTRTAPHLRAVGSPGLLSQRARSRIANRSRSSFPPPNVTGALHLGHALNNTLQDILIRLQTNAGLQRALDAGHRPRGDRDAGGRRTATAGRGGPDAARSRPREAGEANLGVEADQYEATNSRPAEADGLQLRLATRRDSRWTRVCARAVRHTFFDLFQQGADLSRQTAGELGHVPADGGQRRRGVSRDDEGPLLAFPLSGDRSAAGRADARHDRHHASRDDARRHGGGRASRSGRRVGQGRGRTEGTAGRRASERQGRHPRATRRRPATTPQNMLPAAWNSCATWRKTAAC